MQPFSRGTLPVEYSIRVYCEPSLQFSFQDDGQHEFELEGVRCVAALDNGSLLVTATGFVSAQAATEFFFKLQRAIAALSVRERIAISIPSMINGPGACFWSFMPDDHRCNSHGWPLIPIQPQAISNMGAWWYPEHEYVAIGECMRLVPQTQYAIAQFAQGMQGARSGLVNAQRLSEELLLAVSAYGQVKRSTQSVWSFLLTVMVLEMLSTETKTSAATREAIDRIVQEAKAKFENEDDVNLERIRACLDGARKESITTALRSLVRNYCCPGIASNPAQGLFVDAADCDRKVTAIYQVRSKYLHEGRVQLKKQPTYGFAELHSTAMHALGHILTCMLQEAAR
jgi:hypothetical protein